MQRLFDDDVQGVGYVTNVSRLWAYMPTMLDGLSDLMGQATQAGSLTLRQRAVLVTAAASTLGDSYCSLAWGNKLSAELGSEVAATVLRGADDGLDPGEQALAQWARAVAADPNAIEASDVQSLRDAGFDEVQIFAITTFVALRLAFSTRQRRAGGSAQTPNSAHRRQSRFCPPSPSAAPWCPNMNRRIPAGQTLLGAFRQRRMARPRSGVHGNLVMDGRC